jgi:radial spoke head protein 4A
MALEQVRALLKKDTNGASLHQQLCSIIGKLVEEKPPDALATLETLSRYLKESGFSGARAPDTSETIVLDPKTESEKETWCSTVMTLTSTPMESLGTVKALCSVDSFLDNVAMFKWAGVGFGQQASYQIHLSLRQLAAATPGLSKLRFWGKLLGIQNDYFVAEGVIDGTGEADGEVEARGTGANTFSYWVSSGTNAPWVQLPLVRPDHITAARKVKHLMTGDLEADVLTMPFFPGKEKHFLRAQIARISSSSCLALAGFLSADDEGGDGKISETPDFEWPPHEELTSQEKWVHSHAFIHKNGCSKWPEPDNIEDEDLRKKVETDREDEPPRGPLAAISDDKPGLEDGGSKDWAIKQAGDKGMYKFNDNNKSYICTVVKSMRWPGAITVAQGTKFANLYVGYGFKKCDHSNEALAENKQTAKAFPFTSGNEKNPCAPADIMDEPDDHEEQPEPNPQDDDEQSDHAEEDEPAEGEE